MSQLTLIAVVVVVGLISAWVALRTFDRRTRLTVVQPAPSTVARIAPMGRTAHVAETQLAMDLSPARINRER